MATRTYRIEDEPTPGALAQITVNPFWPLLGLMLGGGWLAWPWFVINSLALGSATKKREVLVVLGGVAGLFAAAIAVIVLHRAERLGGATPYLAHVAFPIAKLGIGYLVYTWQTRSFQLYEYFGGTARNGMLVALAGLFLRSRLAEVLHADIWALVLF